MIRFSPQVFAIIVLSMAGCGDAPTAPPVDETGPFRGAWAASLDGLPVTLVLSDPGPSGAFDGCVFVEFTRGTMTGVELLGTVSGQEVAMTAQEGAVIGWTFDGTLSGFAGSELLSGTATGTVLLPDSTATWGSGPVAFRRSDSHPLCTSAG